MHCHGSSTYGWSFWLFLWPTVVRLLDGVDPTTLTWCQKKPQGATIFVLSVGRENRLQQMPRRLIKASDQTNLLFQAVEVVDDDTDEKIQEEEGTHDDEDDKVEIRSEGCFFFWLLVGLMILR